uniref:Prep homeobox protein n=1 Tax=Phallusia mammillata TaxID=59560 RepID=A0A6F9DNY3_9ASCI|nr:prep homeobox protein [Phallusia mammillata]
MNQGMAQHTYGDGQTQDGSGGNGISKSCGDESTLIEKEKQLIKGHPLFALLELLFDKCEKATRGEETPSSATYDDEIQEFVRRQESLMNSIFIDDPEIDNLMIKAIQVLRIHLLELEKVNDLCKDFCHRYITCLKGKMHSENLLRSDMGPFGDVASQHGLLHSGNTTCMASTPNANVTVNQQGEIVAQGMYQQSLPGDSQMLHPSENGIDGSTPLSQVGVSSPPSQHMHGMSSQHLYHHHHQQQQHLASSNGHDDPNGRKTKRGVLPKHATEILRSWLFSHIVHPYPTEDEKRSLATQTNLTLLQVNNWFINARRRILQPMLDASNPEASSTSTTAKTKKTKQQNNRPTDRFWPNTISTSSNGPNSMDEEDSDAIKGDGNSPTSNSHRDNYTLNHSPPPNPVSSTSGHLHHYPHSDVTMSSGAQVALSMVNN